ncbi:MAG: DUF3047 domain-containing protein [Nitrospirota bacterium]
MIAVNTIGAEDISIFFCENFENTDNWKTMEFPRVKKHTVYSVLRQGDESYLKAESNASSSAIVFSKSFNVFDYPKVKWRWKISNVYLKGNSSEKTGDDYPARIFVMFKYDPDKASFLGRVRHGLGKTIFGVEPPYSSLNYIWASTKSDMNIITNPYSPDTKMIVLQAGSENTGKWMQEDVDIIRDYRRAFGEDPPATASIAIMNDSDDTGEHAVSFIDYIEVYR